MAMLYDKNSKRQTPIDLMLVSSDHAFGPHLQLKAVQTKTALTLTIEEIKGIKVWCEQQIKQYDQTPGNTASSDSYDCQDMRDGYHPR